jgi:hypothetical protein
MNARILLSALFLLHSLHPAIPETVKDREGSVRDDRAAMQDSERWIYLDFDKGFAEAKRAGKPLLVVLRCVPCLACAGIDARVLVEDAALSPLLDQFVCVRVINANALDLRRFQFDFDLSFSALMFNGDGTLYGRYGSWLHQHDPNEDTTAGFRATLQAALDMHRDFPKNRIALAGKQGKPTPYKTPVDMPVLSGRYSRDLNWTGKVVASCVHCHQIGDAQRALIRDRGATIPEKLVYPYPASEVVGITMSLESSNMVANVEPATPAAKAGLRAGDRVVSIDNQPVISLADISWALHNAPDEGRLKLALDRDGRRIESELALSRAWRSQSDISRRVGTWQMRAMALGGLQLVEFSPEERSSHGIVGDGMALSVKHLGQYGIHATAKKSGFLKGDVIVEFDGVSASRSESWVIGHALRNYKQGEELRAVVVRNGKRVRLTLLMQ